MRWLGQSHRIVHQLSPNVNPLDTTKGQNKHWAEFTLCQHRERRRHWVEITLCQHHRRHSRRGITKNVHRACTTPKLSARIVGGCTACSSVFLNANFFFSSKILWTFPLCWHCTVLSILGLSFGTETKLHDPRSNGRMLSWLCFERSVDCHCAKHVPRLLLSSHSQRSFHWLYNDAAFPNHPSCVGESCCWCMRMSLGSSSLIFCVLRIHTACRAHVLLCHSVSICCYVPNSCTAVCFCVQAPLTTHHSSRAFFVNTSLVGSGHMFHRCIFMVLCLSFPETLLRPHNHPFLHIIKARLFQLSYHCVLPHSYHRFHICVNSLLPMQPHCVWPTHAPLPCLLFRDIGSVMPSFACLRPRLLALMHAFSNLCLILDKSR